MKFTQWLGMFVGLILFASVGSAGAAQVTYDFEGENLGTFDLYSQTVDELTVDITAYKVKNNDKGKIKKTKQLTGKNRGVYVGKTGLGVKSNRKDGSDLDGGKKGKKKDPDEGLLFTFKRPVELLHLDIGDFGRNDDFNLHVNGVPFLLDYHAKAFGVNDSTTLPNHILQDGVTVETMEDCGLDDNYFTGIFGTEFLVWVDGRSDDIRIDELTVAPVPEPGTLLLLGAGLVGLGVFRVRRKS